MQIKLSTLIFLSIMLIHTLTQCTSKSRPIFNEKDFTGWTIKGDHPEAWTIEDGVIIMKQYDRGRGWLEYEETLDNFELTVEWMVEKGANSGIMLRVPAGKDVDPTWDAIEIQISDDENYDLFWDGKDERELSGAIYGIAAPIENKNRGIGQWNKFVITCIDSTIQLTYNNEKVLDVDYNDYPNSFFMWKNDRKALTERPLKGKIGLQAHKGSVVKFRNILLKEL